MLQHTARSGYGGISEAEPRTVAIWPTAACPIDPTVQGCSHPAGHEQGCVIQQTVRPWTEVKPHCAGKMVACSLISPCRGARLQQGISSSIAQQTSSTWKVVHNKLSFITAGNRAKCSVLTDLSTLASFQQGMNWVTCGAHPEQQQHCIAQQSAA